MVQAALQILRQVSDSTSQSAEVKWLHHQLVPDILCQQGTGPHEVDYTDTLGKVLSL